MNAVIKYPGSKWSIAKKICSLLPPHKSYLEPYFGSGAVFFKKPRSPIETVNDLDGDIVNLFCCIRDKTNELAEAIYYTPYSRSVYDAACAIQHDIADPVEKALQFYIKMQMGHGFRTNGEIVGWKNDIQGREKAYAAKDWAELPDKLLVFAERLRGVQIEHRPAVNLIERFNFENVLIYCDPPYMLNTRHGKQYAYEMTDADHEELLFLLNRHRGPVILSGYHSELYDRELRNWKMLELEAYSQVGSKKTEVLWMNFQIQTEAEQMSLFPEDNSGMKCTGIKINE